MQSNNVDQPLPEEQKAQQAAFEKAMEEEHTVSFKKKELIIIFNILTKIDMKYGDALVVIPLVQKLEPIVAVDTNITKRAEAASGMVGIKKQTN